VGLKQFLGEWTKLHVRLINRMAQINYIVFTPLSFTHKYMRVCPRALLIPHNMLQAHTSTAAGNGSVPGGKNCPPPQHGRTG